VRIGSSDALLPLAAPSGEVLELGLSTGYRLRGMGRGLGSAAGLPGLRVPAVGCQRYTTVREQLGGHSPGAALRRKVYS